MKVAHNGREYCVLSESNIEAFTGVDKMHLIKLAFENPTPMLVQQVLELYPNTNRFIVSDNIRLYNQMFRDTNKKYYVENQKGDGLVSFFKKNNKCVLNFENLLLSEREFIFTHLLEDILYNVEAIFLHHADFANKRYILESWSGNVLLMGDK